MQNQTPQGPRKQYAGRFAGAAGSASTRATSQPASTGTGPSRRPSGFAAPEVPKRAPEPRPKAQEENAKRRRWFKRREKPANNKRGEAKRGAWWKYLLIALALLLALVLLLTLIFGGNKTYHQLPRVERGSDSAYAPEETIAPEGAPAAEPSADLEALIEAGDYEAAAALIQAGMDQEAGE